MPDSANWPGEWYVFEDGRVSGPLDAAAAFGLGDSAPSGKPRMISRKGFSQWYALKDLSEIFRLTEELEHKAKGIPIPPAKSPSSPEVKGRHLGTPHAEPEAQAKPQTAPRPKAVVEAKTAAVSKPEARASTKTTLELKTAKLATKSTLLQEYLIHRQKLRLGKMMNPWIAAFIGLPASLGILWGLWIRRLAQEITHHCEPGQATGKMLLTPILALVPGVHIYMAWRLAKFIEAMEAQNRYRAVSPQTAAWLAIFPPFAMAYLQNAVNRHWLLHVRHVMAEAGGKTSLASDKIA